MGAGFGRVKKERNIIEKCLVSGVLIVLMLRETKDVFVVVKRCYRCWAIDMEF